MKTKSLTILLIVAAGLFLRWLYPLDRLFEFDQNQIAVFAKQIIDKNFTLIGPRTGPAQFFTGPLIYYLGAILLVYRLTSDRQYLSGINYLFNDSRCFNFYFKN